MKSRTNGVKMLKGQLKMVSELQSRAAGWAKLGNGVQANNIGHAALSLLVTSLYGEVVLLREELHLLRFDLDARERRRMSRPRDCS